MIESVHLIKLSCSLIFKTIASTDTIYRRVLKTNSEDYEKDISNNLIGIGLTNCWIKRKARS
jgi:hypothetical protein